MGPSVLPLVLSPSGSMVRSHVSKHVCLLQKVIGGVKGKQSQTFVNGLKTDFIQELLTEGERELHSDLHSCDLAF